MRSGGSWRQRGGEAEGEPEAKGEGWRRRGAGEAEGEEEEATLRLSWVDLLDRERGAPGLPRRLTRYHQLGVRRTRTLEGVRRTRTRRPPRRELPPRRGPPPLRRCTSMGRPTSRRDPSRQHSGRSFDHMDKGKIHSQL